jgi:WD40 repeat protein
MVTCVAFHPHSARRFATGCVDGRVRVWGVGPTEGGVLAWAAIQVRFPNLGVELCIRLLTNWSGGSHVQRLRGVWVPARGAY